MDTFHRTNTSGSIVSSDTSLSGPNNTVSRHDTREFGSRTSVSALPSLPDLIPKTPNINQAEKLPQTVATPENSYVEFDLSGPNNHYEHSNNSKNNISSPRNILSEKVIGLTLNLNQTHELPNDESDLDNDKSNSPSNLGQNKEQEQEDIDDFFDGKNSDWKSMKKISSFDFYDERGGLEFTTDQRFENFDNMADFRAYTKIDTEEQIAKYDELDKQTNFLFEINQNQKTRLEVAHYGQDDESGYDSDEYYHEDNIDSDETLEGTKEMLTEAQRFAYVGIAKLIAVDMATDLAMLQRKSSNKLARSLNGSQKNFANWTMYIMGKLYEHMDLNKEERQMIENLSVHGLEVTDLSNSLIDESCYKLIPTKATPGFDMRWVIVCDLFLLLLSDGYYDSRSRALFIRFAECLKIKSLEIHQFERRLIESLELDTSSKTIENKDELLADRLFIEKHIKRNRNKRIAYIGLATIGGSLAIGLSAGLLAPVIGAGLAAGLTTVGITGTSGFLAGVGGSAIITTGGVLAGAKAGSRAGARRVGDVNTFEFKPLHNNKRANLIITVSGWMNGQADDVRLPFSTVDPVMGDMFSLLWEPEMLQSMGQTIGILATEALATSIQQILGATVLTALMSAIQLPMALSKLAYLLDNPWNVSLDRAWKAGKILADTLISGNMGIRPITLVGFSLGSRLIYSCLIELAKRGGYGLIENVVLLGNPIAVKHDQIVLARTVVSGKFINGYSKKDWILGYLFRATGGGILTVAGLSPIENVHGIENIDCTEFVEGHMAYRKAIPKILKSIGWEVLSEEFTEIEEPDPEQGERARKLISEFDEAKNKMMREKANEGQPNKKNWKNWFKPKQKEWWEYCDETAPGASGPSHVTSDGNTEEYSEQEEIPTSEPGPIFDVSALLQEVNDIQQLGGEDQETLQKVRKDVDTQKKEVKRNEDIEEEESEPVSFVGNITKKFQKP